MADACINQAVEKLCVWSKGAQLSELGRDFCDDSSTFRRYAVARNGDAEAALKNLQESIAWRETHVPAKLHCPVCDVDPFMHCFFPIGLDTQKRLVIYSSASRAKMNDRDVTVQHMVHVLEHGWRSTRALDLHHQWVW